MIVQSARRMALVIAVATAALSGGALAQSPGPLKFSFGGDKAGFTTVSPSTTYSKDKGYGFEAGAVVQTADGHITAEKPFYFSAAVPEGNHRVTLTIGAPGAPTDLTVKAELRRLMLEKVHVDAGRTEKVSFVVNVRTPQYPGGTVRLKDREKTDEIWAWDEKLTIEINGARPNIQAVEIEKVNVPTVFILGDSTVCDQSKEPWNSWGQMFTRFFKDDIAIANHAQSGESVGSSLGAKRFEKVFAEMKPGDYLFMQFGHNDMKGPNLEQYKVSYKNIIEQTKAKGGTPVIVSSMERKGGVNSNTLQGYPAAAEEVAKANGAVFIDLHGMSQQLYKGLGTELNSAFQDGTHHNNFGSYLISKLVLEGVRQNKMELVKHIKDNVPAFDPGKPDKVATFVVPASPAFSMQRPLGD